ncbi:hypothetical protein CFD26_102998 [Aspergillus turcosus]|uniref:Uncharacterized protein n=1 Tax=Aspergillus turcosus TaxID=1245748 RepID=A0A421D0M5_9EURO|nr:hypothetical protein CFD26_102998 [Aspergillus turcosus]
MKFTLLTTALLTLTVTPLSVLADPSPTTTTTTVVLRKCYPLYGDMSEGEVWHIQDVFCYSDCLGAGYNVGACDRAA